MTILGKAKETVVAAGEHVATAMRVAIVACVLSLVALVISASVAMHHHPRLAAHADA